MLQLHLSDQQFYCLLGCGLYWRFYGVYHSIQKHILGPLQYQCKNMSTWPYCFIISVKFHLITWSSISEGLAASCVLGTYPISEVFKTDTSICFEETNNTLISPSALVLKGLWQIPMVQCDHGLDTWGPEGVNEAVIIRNALGIDRVRRSIW